MDGVDIIYCNYFGATFYLKHSTLCEFNKVNLVFNKKAFLLSTEELTGLYSTLKFALSTLEKMDGSEAKLSTITALIEINGTNFHFTLTELRTLETLIGNTLFQINFSSIILKL